MKTASEPFSALEIVFYRSLFGASATLGQLAMALACRLGHALMGGSFAYSAIVFAALPRFLLFRPVGSGARRR